MGTKYYRVRILTPDLFIVGWELNIIGLEYLHQIYSRKRAKYYRVRIFTPDLFIVGWELNIIGLEYLHQI